MPRPIIAALRDNMRRALKEKRHEDAEQILSRLKQEDPLSPETRGFELELCLNAGRLGEADTLARQLCRLFPDSGRISFLAGRVAYQLRDYARSDALFRESYRIYPHWRTQYWLAKALTQLGHFEEAESLLLLAREHTPDAVLQMAWLFERRNDLEAALKHYEEFLAAHPGHSFALEQRLRVKARMLEPESLIEEAGALAELGEELPAVLLTEYIQKLFDTGQTVKARDEIMVRIGTFDAKIGSQLAWICYRAKAYDLACTLFLSNLQPNLGYYKYLNALESAAAKCGRIPQVLEAYRSFAGKVPSLHGRAKSLDARSKRSR
jgi:tetratricopeptide (TPR) repeat protein